MDFKSAVVGVGEQDQAMNHRPSYIATRRHQGLPARKGYPGSEISQELTRPGRRKAWKPNGTVRQRSAPWRPARIVLRIQVP